MRGKLAYEISSIGRLLVGAHALEESVQFARPPKDVQLGPASLLRDLSEQRGTAPATPGQRPQPKIDSLSGSAHSGPEKSRESELCRRA